MRKKIRNMYLTLSSFLLSYLLLCPVNVYASDTSDAVADIMNSDRFAGAISSIEWLTTRIDYWFTMVITAAGFFIISAALLKNACAGAYCANHKFWDKVAEAHEKAESLQLSQLFGGGIKDKIMNISTSGIKDAILCIVPNIKAFTDFDDADIEPKQYFMKAIPQMLGCIIIGVFIYNGYYRDTAASVGNFGSEICSRVFSSVDPATWVDKLTQTTGTPATIYDNDQTLEGKALLQITKSLYKTYLSNAKDLTSTEAKTSLMRDCESKAQSILGAGASGTDGSDMSSIESTFFSDERIYDYSLGNLKIVPCPAANAQNLGTMTVTCLDTDTKSEYALSGYQSFDSSFVNSNIIPADKACFHITFTMKGGQKTETTGLTTLKAAAGSWSSRTATAVPVSITASEYSQNSKGAYTVKVLNFANTLAQNASIKDAAKAVVVNEATNGADNFTYTDFSVSNYPGQSGTFVCSTVPDANSYTCEVKCKVVVGYTDSKGNNGSMPVTVPVNLTITH